MQGLNIASIYTIGTQFIFGDYTNQSLYIEAYISTTGTYNITAQHSTKSRIRKFISLVTNSFVSGVPIVGVIEPYFPLYSLCIGLLMSTSLYQFNLAADQSLHIEINATDMNSLDLTLIEQSFRIAYSNTSACFDIPTCNMGIHNFLVSSHIPQNYTLTITQSTGKYVSWLTNYSGRLACPNCCANTGLCNNGNCSCSPTWTGTDCSSKIDTCLSDL